MSLTLLDWRRRVADSYRQVREATDAVAAHRQWRQTRDELFCSHPDSPLPPEERTGFTGVPVAPYDPAFRVEAEIDSDVAAVRLEVPTGTDGAVPFVRIGRVHLGGRGGFTEPADLDVWWLASYGGGVFVPVKDGLAGRGNYGGGRYLIDTVKGADLGGDPEAGTLVLDFNFAYNPSCAYDRAWACPLAPPGNVLRQPVPAGELSDRREVLRL